MEIMDATPSDFTGDPRFTGPAAGAHLMPADPHGAALDTAMGHLAVQTETPGAESVVWREAVPTGAVSGGVR